jgi:uncharacterized membrane protein
MKKEGCDCNCNNSSGVASVVLGIIGLVTSIAVLPIVISITALVFGIVQYRAAKNKWAVWGIILSILGILISILVIWKLYALSAEFRTMVNTCVENPSAPGCESLLPMLGAAQ